MYLPAESAIDVLPGTEYPTSQLPAPKIMIVDCLDGEGVEGRLKIIL